MTTQINLPEILNSQSVVFTKFTTESTVEYSIQITAEFTGDDFLITTDETNTGIPEWDQVSGYFLASFTIQDGNETGESLIVFNHDMNEISFTEEQSELKILLKYNGEVASTTVVNHKDAEEDTRPGNQKAILRLSERDK